MLRFYLSRVRRAFWPGASICVPGSVPTHSLLVCTEQPCPHLSAGLESEVPGLDPQVAGHEGVSGQVLLFRDPWLCFLLLGLHRSGDDGSNCSGWPTAPGWRVRI